MTVQYPAGGPPWAGAGPPPAPPGNSAPANGTRAPESLAVVLAAVAVFVIVVAAAVMVVVMKSGGDAYNTRSTADGSTGGAAAPLLVGSGRIVFADDFRDPASGWTRQTLASGTSFSY